MLTSTIIWKEEEKRKPASSGIYRIFLQRRLSRRKIFGGN